MLRSRLSHSASPGHRPENETLGPVSLQEGVRLMQLSTRKCKKVQGNWIFNHKRFTKQLQRNHQGC